MEIVWLEDFVEIAATRNFSAAAAARNVSQSAFSRRIKALEEWLGVDLVDRSTSPVRLTATGGLFAPRCQELVDDIYRLRVECQQNEHPHNLILSFAALHTIEIFFFPQWLVELRERIGVVQSHMHGGDFLDCIESLSLGTCDFAILYYCPEGPPVFKSGLYKSQIVGHDRLIPVSGCDAQGQPVYGLDGPADDPVPFLAYSWKDGYLGKLISIIQGRQRQAPRLKTVYQSSLAEGIKRMAIAGMGIAWLPLSSAKDAIEQGRLAQIGDDRATIELEVRLYRRAGPSGTAAEAFWTQLGG